MVSIDVDGVWCSSSEERTSVLPVTYVEEGRGGREGGRAGRDEEVLSGRGVGMWMVGRWRVEVS